MNVWDLMFMSYMAGNKPGRSAACIAAVLSIMPLITRLHRADSTAVTYCLPLCTCKYRCGTARASPTTVLISDLQQRV